MESRFILEIFFMVHREGVERITPSALGAACLRHGMCVLANGVFKKQMSGSALSVLVIGNHHRISRRRNAQESRSYEVHKEALRGAIRRVHG